MSQPKFLSPISPRPEAPLFVFLPGMDGSGLLLHRQVAALAHHFEIHCLSLPANDLSDWHELTVIVLKLIDEVITGNLDRQLVKARATQPDSPQDVQNKLGQQFSRPIYLCGESFGACLALLVASQQPDLVNRLILINPASSFTRQPLFRLGHWAAELMPPSLYSLTAIGLLPWLIETERVSASDRRTLLLAMQAVHPKTAAWRLRLLSEFDLGEMSWDRLKMPTLLIAGERDRLLQSSQEIQRIAHHLPQAHTSFLSNSGHACLLEKQVNLFQLLKPAFGPIYP